MKERRIWMKKKRSFVTRYVNEAIIIYPRNYSLGLSLLPGARQVHCSVHGARDMRQHCDKNRDKNNKIIPATIRSRILSELSRGQRPHTKNLSNRRSKRKGDKVYVRPQEHLSNFSMSPSSNRKYIDKLFFR